MSANPGTYESFLTAGHTLGRARRRRERVGGLLVLVGAAVVLGALLVIPAFLTASVLSWAPLPADAWERLGVLMAGTAKAALYAMVVAVPVGAGAAIFSSEFAAPGFRAWFKPSLEILEAIPTVVLGLIASATIAPWLKLNVGTLLVLIVAVPALLLAVGTTVGAIERRRAGWLPFWMLPAFLIGIAALAALFGPIQRGAIEPYSPWNALLVGLALGLAAVPLVFSLAEDALMLIPSSHRRAALALGATRWQALRSIVVPLARPGLVAAAVLGASRCLGETMIVLMASGNTPIVDADPLTGLRTISAELAIRLPETAPPSGPYRALLLAALALFGVTFALNLLAERVRSRLRRRAEREASQA
jgi:phosphate transport system permease protein